MGWGIFNSLFLILLQFASCHPCTFLHDVLVCKNSCHVSFLCRKPNFPGFNSIVSWLVFTELGKNYKINKKETENYLLTCFYFANNSLLQIHDKTMGWAFSNCIADFQRVPALLGLSAVSFLCVRYFLKLFYSWHALHCSAVMQRRGVCHNCPTWSIQALPAQCCVTRASAKHSGGHFMCTRTQKDPYWKSKCSVPPLPMSTQ